MEEINFNFIWDSDKKVIFRKELITFMEEQKK